MAVTLFRTLFVLLLVSINALNAASKLDGYFEKILPPQKSIYDFMINLEKLDQTQSYDFEQESDQNAKPTLYGKKNSKIVIQDALGNKTKYYYGKDRLLERVEKLSASSLLQMAETFLWSNQNGDEKPKLLVRTLFDEDMSPRLSHVFSYDLFGNLTEETVYGTFTGTKSGEIHLHSDGYPKSRSSSDVMVTSYTHTEDSSFRDVVRCDPLGNYTYFRYKKDTNLLLQLLTCEGKEIKKRQYFHYDGNNLLTLEIVDDGNTFDEESLLGVSERHIKRITPKLKDPKGVSSEIISEYFWDFQTSKEVLLTKTINTFSPQGELIKKEISSADGQVLKVFEYAYNDAGKMTYSKDPENRVQIFEYDRRGLLTMKKGPRDDVQYLYAYDNASNLIEETEVHLPSKLTFKNRYEYDELGRKIAIIDPQGNRVEIAYDSLGRVTLVTLPSISGLTGTIDTITRQYSYKKVVQEILETDELGNEQQKSFSSTGKILKISFPDDSKKKFAYDLLGRLVSEVTANNVDVEHRYDVFDRRILTREEKAGDLLSTHVWKYSTFHELSYHGPTNEETILSYDFAGRKILEKKAISKNSYKTTHFSYDDFGRIIEEKQLLSDRSFILKRTSFDKLDRITKEQLFDENNTLHSDESLVYDLEGNLHKVMKKVDKNKALESTTYFSTEVRPLKIVDFAGNTTLFERNFFYVNSLGQKVLRETVIFPNLEKVVKTFNALGFIENELYFDANGNKMREANFLYDAAGNLTYNEIVNFINGKKSKKFITANSYDNMHRLVSKTEASDSEAVKTTSYLYSVQGVNYLSIYPKGVSTVKYYDRKGRVECFQDDHNTLHYSYVYDASDRIIKATNLITDGKTVRSYNGLGKLSSETLETGLSFSYVHDLLGRLTKIVFPDKSQLVYEYSPCYLKNILKFNAQGVLVYTYIITQNDLLGRVLSTSFSQNGKTFAYNFDVRDDFFDAQKNSLDFYKNANDHLLRQNGSTSYLYDENGNRIEARNGLDVQTYRYDGLNRLIEIDTKKINVKYSYDPFNRRVKKKIYKKESAQEYDRNFLYIDDCEVGLMLENGKILQNKICDASFKNAFIFELKGLPFIPILDQNQNVSKLVSTTTGEIVESYQYSPLGLDESYNAYGEKIAESLVKNPWRMKGRRVEPETKLIYNDSLFYDPQIGLPIHKPE